MSLLLIEEAIEKVAAGIDTARSAIYKYVLKASPKAKGLSAYDALNAGTRGEVRNTLAAARMHRDKVLGLKSAKNPAIQGMLNKKYGAKP